MNLDSYLSPYAKFTIKWFKYLNIRPGPLKLREAKVRNIHELTYTEKDFLNRHPVTLALRATINKW